MWDPLDEYLHRVLHSMPLAAQNCKSRLIYVQWWRHTYIRLKFFYIGTFFFLLSLWVEKVCMAMHSTLYIFKKAWVLLVSSKCYSLVFMNAYIYIYILYSCMPQKGLWKGWKLCALTYWHYILVIIYWERERRDTGKSLVSLCLFVSECLSDLSLCYWYCFLTLWVL